MDEFHSDSVLLKEAGERIERALQPLTRSFMRPTLMRQADDRLQRVFYRTESDDTREAVRLLRIALRAIK